MANRMFKQFQGTLENGVVKLYGYFVSGALGVVASSSMKGFSVAKTATEVGRYTLTLEDKYTALLSTQISLQGPVDAAYGVGGATTFIRGEDVDATGVAATPILYLQVADGALADAELPSGTKVFIELTLKNSTAY